jgi:hypothetical protein
VHSGGLGQPVVVMDVVEVNRVRLVTLDGIVAALSAALEDTDPQAKPYRNACELLRALRELRERELPVDVMTTTAEVRAPLELVGEPDAEPAAG